MLGPVLDSEITVNKKETNSCSCGACILAEIGNKNFLDVHITGMVARDKNKAGNEY